MDAGDHRESKRVCMVSATRLNAFMIALLFPLLVSCSSATPKTVDDDGKTPSKSAILPLTSTVEPSTRSSQSTSSTQVQALSEIIKPIYIPTWTSIPKLSIDEATSAILQL
jgi:hypothetical protein